MRPPRLLSAVLLLSLTSACASDETPVPGEPPASVRERLATGPRLVGLFPDEADISLDVLLRRGDGWQVHPTSLALDHGSVSLAAGPDGDVELTAAQLTFEDILVGDKGVPPTGLHLTGVKVTTRAAHECDWVDWAPDDDACSTSIPAVFYLDWSMVATDGEVIPLGTQKLAPMDLWVDVAGDRHGIAADVRALEPDTLWSWAGMVEFRHLVIEASGHEIIPL